LPRSDELLDVDVSKLNHPQLVHLAITAGVVLSDNPPKDEILRRIGKLAIH